MGCQATISHALLLHLRIIPVFVFTLTQRGRSYNLPAVLRWRQALGGGGHVFGGVRRVHRSMDGRVVHILQARNGKIAA